ncbi:TIGR04454 family lipoprotein [Leptospira sp. GIMC2001]|uniref:TIGR04454 family lipoprotein n=1 Tax=Leptospira sp. GIMC2001 TaxID=1513297 RepID=UPI00234ABEBE|nr:TIGR04454 family lipoprotein [Leptospira sp. GIMC2001]WCL47644.1 TIGR04454 family lipoprotein [Leptospira sp. GIMC2001]
MKRIFLVLAILGVLGFVNCGGGNVYTSEQCEASLNNVFDKVTDAATEEDKAKFAPMKATLMGKLKKDCMEGKFDLDCLDKATNIAALQTCLK